VKIFFFFFFGYPINFFGEEYVIKNKILADFRFLGWCTISKVYFFLFSFWPLAFVLFLLFLLLCSKCSQERTLNRAYKEEKWHSLFLKKKKKRFIGMDSRIIHCWVVRRKIANTPIRWKDFAHSGLLFSPLFLLSLLTFPLSFLSLYLTGLLFQTQSKEFFLVEYTKPGIAIAIPVTFQIISTNQENSFEEIRMEGFTWTKQLKGRSYNGPLTPAQARAKMQGLMNGYSLTEENCHFAQENLRKEMGIFN